MAYKPKILELAAGGTNASLTADNGGILYSTASAVAILGSTSTGNQPLLSGASGAPGWSTATYPGSTTAFQLLVSTAANTVGQLTAGSTGTVLTGVTGAVPAFSATPAVTSITLGGGTALANYVQGTFTPGLSFGGGTTGITYNNQTGVYVRIGRVVYIQCTVGITSKGSSTGAAKLTGLPITVSGAGQFMDMLNASGITYPATYLQLAANPDDTATTATLDAFTTVSVFTGLADTNFANATTFYVQGFYFA